MRSLGRLSLGILLPCAVFAQSQNDPVRAPAGKNANDPIYAEGYIKPPDAVARLVAAPRSSNFTWGNPSPTRKYLLHAYTEEPVLEFLGKRHYNLGGWQIDPAASRSRSMTYRNTSGYDLLDWATGKTIKVQLPAGARGSTFTSWSPDGSTFAYFAQFPDATHIYLADPATGVSRPLTKVTVVATNVENFAWTADGKSIVTVLAADNRGPEPKEPVIADGIRVRVNENNTLKTRNYPDLLDGPFEQTLFEYYNMGQLALIDVKTRVVTKVGEPGPITRLDPSPDAKFFRVTYIDRPFSYVLPTSSFGTHEVIIDGTGKVLKEMAKRPLREGTASDIVDPNDPNGGQQGGGGFGGRGGGGGEQDTVHRGLTWHPFESGLMFMRSAREDSTVRADSIKAAAANRATRGGRGGAGGNGGRGGRGGGGGARGGGGAGGGPGADSTAARPDTLFLWTAPFVGPNSSILKPLYVTKGNGTINGVQFSNDGKIMFVNQTVNRQTTTDAIFLAENNATFTVTRGGGGGGAPAGRGGGAGGRGGRGGGGGGGGVGLLTREGTRGVTVVMQSSDGKSVYAPAVGADSANADSAAAPAAGGRGGRGGRGGAAGPRNAIDRIDIRTGTRTRVYETTVTDMTEQAVTPLDNDFTKALATRTNRTTPPESFLVDVASKNATQLTTSKDYWPEITNAIHKTAFAKRPDGVNIRIRVTLPQDWKPGTRLPALFWFYPAEFDSAAAYTTSLTSGRGGAPPDNANGPGTFANVGQRTMSIITAAGYALVENDAPIIATPGKLPNDNYPTDLQWNLEAAVNALVDSGWVDRNRLALGGHSYGAFSTMNGLTLTTLFKAGIAGDGMYNRTLTPNGFQNERRDLWTGQATYLAMSPMLRADKLNGAILMYHSEEDQNVGTDPISSIRMYQALMANGKTASLYMYPYEDHGPVARESNLDQWARWVAWLDKYVKNPQPNKTNAQ